MILNRRREQGFSLIELVIGMTILAVLFALLFITTAQVDKGKDAKRKDDLEKVRIAFEDYFNDHGCYPDDNVLDNCGSGDFSPYLNSIPCDPVTKEPYTMFSQEAVPCHQWFIVFSLLKYVSDPAIARGECPQGCTVPNDSGGWDTYNWAVSSPNVRISDLLWDIAGCGTGCLVTDVTGTDCDIAPGNSCSGDRCFNGGDCNPNCKVDSCP